MKIFVTGKDQRIAELQEKTGKLKGLDLIVSASAEQIVDQEIVPGDIILDLNLDDQPENLEFYTSMKGITVLGCAVKMQLAMMVYLLDEEVECNLYGINALPTFINRPILEMSTLHKPVTDSLKEIIKQLGWNISEVKDRVGMVTPRVLFMIINEASFALQEGTAGMDDIDLAMQLGTNYPRGPFAWADDAGIEEVCETLDAIYMDTGDERYKICPLMKTKYLRGESFRQPE
ncbi:MAG: 3-hydroxyacyl-CoA dehydrogenase family protein [Bacteroidia bacterium]